MLSLREIGVRTPLVYAIVPDEKVMVREHLEGVSLEEMAAGKGPLDPTVLSWVRRFAEILSKVHGARMSVGDTKPSNILCEGEKISLIDLEQCRVGGDYAWDVAEFVYYSCMTMNDPLMAFEFGRAFASAYVEEGDPAVLRGAQDQAYTLPFQVLVQPDVLRSAKQGLL